MANSDKTLLNEQVTFVQHQLPGLDAGEYQLSASQVIYDQNGNQVNTADLANTYSFAVKGDRFSLSAPAQTVAAVFPAENDTGEFTAVLPHVLFYKKTFPWIRMPAEGGGENKKTENPKADADVPTWLTVLLLDEDDQVAFPGLSLSPTKLTIGDLFPPAANSSTSLGNNISYFDGAVNTNDLDYGESLSDPIQVVDLPLQLFWQIAPSLTDLHFLAHSRKVSLINKPSNPNVDPPGEPTGNFSIVFGNRFPQSIKKAYAYLVSLENLGAFLPNDDGTAPSTQNPTDTRFIRLAVLKNWNFFATGYTAGFTDQVLALNGGTSATNFNLRIEPKASSGTVVKNALNMGFTALNHQLRSGGQTVSWYRGPLVPYQVTSAPVTLPIDSADKACFFDPTTGMFDLSYSAAWTIGRMISLQDKAFSTALYNWKKTAALTLIATIENELIAEQFEEPSTEVGSSEIRQTRNLQQQLMTHLTKLKAHAIQNIEGKI